MCLLPWRVDSDTVRTFTLSMGTCRLCRAAAVNIEAILDPFCPIPEKGAKTSETHHSTRPTRPLFKTWLGSHPKCSRERSINYSRKQPIPYEDAHLFFCLCIHNELKSWFPGSGDELYLDTHGCGHPCPLLTRSFRHRCRSSCCFWRGLVWGCGILAYGWL